MPGPRISLAELMRETGVTPAAPHVHSPFSGQWRFDLKQVDGSSAPTVGDLSECLFFSPGDGRIWLQDQRMLLVHSEALGGLRRELIETIGIDKARGLLTRMGYLSGARDAKLVRRQWPDAEPPVAAIAGARLHALEGQVKVEVVRLSYDAATGEYQGEFLWHNSSEDDEHIAAYGVGGSPACWTQTGYATGYVSTLFGRLILFREVACRSSGDAQCRVIGRSVDLWEDPQEDLRYLQLGDEAVTAEPAAAALDNWAKLGAMSGQDPTLVGASSAFNAAFHMVRRVAPTPATVLFTGESGVGKEMFARSLHRSSDRASSPFVAINCAAIPDTLIESELFGVERGAFTGAGASRPGRFERADGGTLFLDEIGTLSLVAQGKLLRALQEGEIERVGGTKTLRVNVRVVAATNEQLRDAVRQGRFREDLFYRLNVFPIHLPPLRERRDDIPLLMQHFLDYYRERYQRDVRGFSQRAVKMLFNYGFPGNIRELQNLIERAVIMVNDGELIDVHQLFRGGEDLGVTVLSLSSSAVENDSGARLVDGPERNSQQTPVSAAPLVPGQTLEEAEQQWIAAALRRSGGNIAVAARQLGITRATLLYRAKRHGIRLGRTGRSG